MDRRALHDESLAVVDIVQGIVFTLLTCGIYGLVWQYKQMQTLNAWQDEERYDFAMYLVFSILTCGIYAIFMEYKMANSINHIQRENDFIVNENLATICLLLSIFGLSIVSLAIQQTEINKWYGQ